MVRACKLRVLSWIHLASPRCRTIFASLSSSLESEVVCGFHRPHCSWPSCRCESLLSLLSVGPDDVKPSGSLVACRGSASQFPAWLPASNLISGTRWHSASASCEMEKRELQWFSLRANALLSLRPVAATVQRPEKRAGPTDHH